MSSTRKYDDNYVTKNYSRLSLYSLGTLQSVHHSHQSSSQGIPCTNNNPNLGGNSPLVMPVFPLRTSQSGHGSHYSPYSPSRFVFENVKLFFFFFSFTQFYVTLNIFFSFLFVFIPHCEWVKASTD